MTDMLCPLLSARHPGGCFNYLFLRRVRRHAFRSPAGAGFGVPRPPWSSRWVSRVGWLAMLCSVMPNERITDVSSLRCFYLLTFCYFYLYVGTETEPLALLVSCLEYPSCIYSIFFSPARRLSPFAFSFMFLNACWGESGRRAQNPFFAVENSSNTY
ncbi:hypothetical protein K458DRAFT_190912 [Lentithecium fluviatile CBS 122367]|uniref:Uncharacterized protein n=1 Tax=Lentithecium fluviatile CBS 122367 TaxID=1168545 RepID=A0A6G1JBC9_9PLEO|nr:hypothetical protein K458DRAFT_190912 [Lentithecium fluviatile CBS 122367]